MTESMNLILVGNHGVGHTQVWRLAEQDGPAGRYTVTAGRRGTAKARRRLQQTNNAVASCPKQTLPLRTINLWSLGNSPALSEDEIQIVASDLLS